ncbi:MAG: hypothetical protein KME10_28590 [Plectolyngbya sp. WJT66-NPBG17]|jgi:hypothetical protein|nr:hypothetical protein [Plectolyngbya sp. WJT66-NPBG17]
MPYKKKQSTILTKCRERAMNLQVIHPNLDLGNGLTMKTYQAAIDTHQANLDNYNRAISTITELALSFEESDKMLRDINERMLLGVGAVYGKDSKEYGTAGGKRKSEVVQARSRARSNPTAQKSTVPTKA